MKKLRSLLLVACCAIGFGASAQTILIQNNTSLMIDDIDFDTYWCTPMHSQAGSLFPGSVTTHTLCGAPMGTDAVTVCFYDASCIPFPTVKTCITATCLVPANYTLCNSTVITLNYDCAFGNVIIY